MKKYRFRLDQVLRVRRIQEEQARHEVLRARHAADEAVATTEARLSSYRDFEQAPGPQSLASHRADRTLHELRADAVRGARSRENTAKAVVADRLGLWSQAAQKVSGLERLDERRREEYDVEAKRDEDRTVDDLVVSRFDKRPKP